MSKKVWLAFFLALATYSVGQSVPDFTLKDAQGKDFTLSSLHGHNVVLYFYRGYW